MNKFIIEEQNVGERLDNFILTKFQDRSRSHIKKQIESGEIILNGKTVKA